MEWVGTKGEGSKPTLYHVKLHREVRISVRSGKEVDRAQRNEMRYGA